MKPLLKWAGGKTRLLPELLKYVPETYNKYIEPFLGGGALLFALKPTRAIVGDANKDLLKTYQAVQLTPTRIIDMLDIYKPQDSKAVFLEICNILTEPNTGTNHERAAMFIYINHTCFNGLYRVNKAGSFNVPYGNYKNPALYNASNLIKISIYMRSHVLIDPTCTDYRTVLLDAKPGDFIYCDPPYHGGFTAYTAKGFTKRDQADLARICSELAAKGCHILASNSNTDFIRQTWSQYGCFNIHEVMASRSISCKGDVRGKVKELIITNVKEKGHGNNAT